MLKIAVIPNCLKDKDLSVTKELVDILRGRAEIYMQETSPGIDGVNYAGDEIYSLVDVVTVIGGDGTIIASALECAENNVPLLGINLGRVGFMSELEVSEMKNGIDKLLSGDYTEEKRMMMDIEIVKKNGEKLKFCALNDVVVQKTGNAKLIGLDLFSDGEKISHYISDGLIVSTPTGSTGYNFSAGGPVVNPLMSLYVATAMCPHMLGCRPAVMPAERNLVIKTDTGFNNEAIAVVDGKTVCCVENGDEITVTKSVYETKLIKIVKRSFYDTIIEKLS